MKGSFHIRKEIKVAVALVMVSGLIAFSERQRGGLVCKDITIELDNVHENHFIDEADVMKLVESSGVPLKGSHLSRLDLRAVEEKIKYDRHIRDAELFTDLKGNLVVNVELRRPIARIIQEDAPDAYIAEDGTIMSVSERYTSRVLLLSGPYVKKLIDMDNLNTTEEGRQMMEMLEYVREDRFWNAQVAQLDIAANGKITIYPQITGQRVEFGKPENIETKFDKLMVFYREILPQRGWTRYQRVNLEFEGQVIAE